MTKRSIDPLFKSSGFVKDRKMCFEVIEKLKKL
nr:MAG TPA: hypothetical protein [Caudoviricetes sp.]